MVRAMAGGVRITVRAQPRASRDAIAGVVDDGRGATALKIAVRAPPVEGAANDAIARVLSAALGLPRGAVTVARGASGRAKIVEVRGIGVEETLRKLGV
jgi:uncharacterized protein